jgi:hypothetical protein
LASTNIALRSQCKSAPQYCFLRPHYCGFD